eukprot:CAMPEP_0184863676 /NCGR_PEP_ID=MMETSP0580-20130426/12147_1 /TAXON_ID=1118495 /ORGANISM="Dactyliosolen fragilissimus" /LENGTH=250 /DNA_ID=CAMNT_0027362145 /DNA_START=29 /DNA_END=781 /DNA_ORIENTATION=+
MSNDTITGTVKWFSNRKGYGFITPVEGSSTSEDVFVHQSVINSEGYRTLDEGWTVEFKIGRDDDGKIKAEHVTAPGGGPCTGPRVRRRRENKSRNEIKPIRTSQPFWHDSLSADVKSVLKEKNIQMSTGTIDLAVGPARVKLGTRGYSSMANKNRTVAEGSFECDSDGNVVMTWTKAIKCDGEWKPIEDTSTLLSKLSLSDESVDNVKMDETCETLMGEDVIDPKSALESNGFEMRRIVLTSKRRSRQKK